MKRRLKDSALGVLLLLTIFLSIGCSQNIVAETLTENPVGTFPSIHIETDLPIDRYIWGDVVVTMSNTTQEFQFEDVHGRIRGRGNSSWRLDKTPFRIRFDEERTMLDSDHAARDWTFIPNHSDKSLMRNYSAYHLASLLDGMSFAPFAGFVDVYFNGEYQGVYMLSIQVQVNEGRAELTYDPDPAVSEFLIEMDTRVPQDEDSEEGVTFVTVNNRHYDILFPRGNDLTIAHVEYIRNFLTKVDDLIHAHDNSVFEHIHLASFVDFYIVQELYKNVDIGYASVFMQIKGQGYERRLEMGPVWDFDIAAGNAYFQGNNREGEEYPYYYSPHGLWAAWTNSWFRNLMYMPVFFDATAVRWNEIRDVEIRATINHIIFMAEEYQYAFERNFDRWPILGEELWPNPQRVAEIDTFQGQVDYLVEWLEIRIVGFDAFFNPSQNF